VRRGAVALSLLLGAAVAVAQAPERTLKDLPKAAPPLRKGETVAPDPARARELYRGFLDLPGGDPALRTEALRRLADLELETGDAERAEAPVPGAGAPETRSAIELYTRLLAEQPDYARADAVLYQLSRAYEAEGDLDRALARLDELVARHPSSRFVPEAQFRRGEILFSAQRWPEAEQAYAAVIGAGERSEFLEQALYKHGWTLFRQSDAERSAASFLTLLDRKLADPTAADGARLPETLPRADRELVEDSFRALSIQFTDIESGEALAQALARHGGAPYGWMLYASLGDLLVQKERYTDAADTYRRFAREEPRHRRAPTLQARAIDAYLAGGFADLALEGKREFVQAYRVAGPFWEGRDQADAPEVVAQLKSHLTDLARYHHARAQADRQPAEFAEAARWYREYLESFPDDPSAAETRYLLADALFEGGDFREAALEYERTAYGYPAGPRSAAAGYAALVSYDRHEQTLPQEGRAEWRRAGIDSQLRFAATFDDHPEAPAVELRAAQQLFNLREHALAAEAAARSLVHVTPLVPESERTAWNVIGDARFELGEFAAAEAAYVQVLGRLPAADPARAPIEERLAASIYRQAEAQQQAGDAEGAVAGFLRVASAAPNSSIRVNATYDAAALLLAGEQWERAIPVLEGFRREFPDHPLAASVPRSLATAYLGAGRGREAADELTRVADDPREDAAVRRAALIESADLYEQAGDLAAAAAAWERFIERHPEPFEDAYAARQKLDGLYVQAGDLAAASRVWERFVQGHPARFEESMAALQRLADLARETGDSRGRVRWLEALVAADAAGGAARSDASRTLAAKATLELAEPRRVAFESIALKAPLPASLKAKRDALDQALTAYQAANAYGVAEVSTAATFATAELYRRLATDLMASERPRGLDEEALEQYDLLLEEQAYPFEERAIELHEANAARAAQGLFDASVQASYAALAALKPARYGKAEIEPADDPSLAPAVAPTLAGIAHRRAGRFAEAREAYGAALALDPLYAPAHLNLAVLLDLYLGEAPEAMAHYRQYLALAAEPDPRAALWAREASNRTGIALETPEEAPQAAAEASPPGNAEDSPEEMP
jgi:tetratricopeptide (TPR) repeat protein